MSLKQLERSHLQALGRGSRESFKWLFDHYFSQVFHYCHRMLRSKHDAEEIASDVFLIVWRKRAYLDSSMSLQPFLFKVSKDLVWTHLKRIANTQRKRDTMISHFIHRRVHGRMDFPFWEQQELLENAMKRLSPRQEKVFVLRYFHGMNLQEIAHELCISKNTVKVHLAKSKKLVTDSLNISN